MSTSATPIIRIKATAKRVVCLAAHGSMLPSAAEYSTATPKHAAAPISSTSPQLRHFTFSQKRSSRRPKSGVRLATAQPPVSFERCGGDQRSEERRVGKEGR